MGAACPAVLAVIGQGAAAPGPLPAQAELPVLRGGADGQRISAAAALWVMVTGRTASGGASADVPMGASLPR